MALAPWALVARSPGREVALVVLRGGAAAGTPAAASHRCKVKRKASSILRAASRWLTLPDLAVVATPKMPAGPSAAHPTIAVNAPSTAAAPSRSIDLQIEGMSCASCVMRVEKALGKLPGVTQATVNLATEQAHVLADASVTADALVAAVRQAGYAVSTTELSLQVEGMTCATCAARVETALLKIPGVTSASVNLATERATVRAVSTVAVAELEAAIERAGYAARELDAAKPTLGPSRLPMVAGGGWRGTHPAAGRPHAAAAPRHPLDAQWLAAVRAGHAGAVLAGLALLPRGLEGAARRNRQHGPAGGAGHLGGLRPVGLPAARACGPGAAAPVLRGQRGGHHAGAARQVAGRPRQAPDDRRHPRAECVAPGHGPGAAWRNRVRRAGRPGECRRHRPGATRRTHRRRRRGAGRPQPGRRIPDHRREPARVQGTGGPGDRRFHQRRRCADA